VQTAVVCANCSGVCKLQWCVSASLPFIVQSLRCCGVVMLTKTYAKFRTQNGHSCCSPKQKPNDISRDTTCTNLPLLPSNNPFYPNVWHTVLVQQTTDGVSVKHYPFWNPHVYYHFQKMPSYCHNLNQLQPVYRFLKMHFLVSSHPYRYPA